VGDSLSREPAAKKARRHLFAQHACTRSRTHISTAQEDSNLTKEHGHCTIAHSVVSCKRHFHRLHHRFSPADVRARTSSVSLTSVVGWCRSKPVICSLLHAVQRDSLSGTEDRPNARFLSDLPRPRRRHQRFWRSMDVGGVCNDGSSSVLTNLTFSGPTADYGGRCPTGTIAGPRWPTAPSAPIPPTRGCAACVTTSAADAEGYDRGPQHRR